MNEYQYIIDSVSLKQRYDRICQIITALEIQQIAAAVNSDVESYALDNGQTRINTAYRGAESIAKAIIIFERLKNKVLQELTGTAVITLRDANTIRHNYGN